MSEKIRWPSIKEVTAALRNVRDSLPTPRQAGDHEESTTDVRLRVQSGDWDILSGPSDYDTDHRGYWGASCVSAEDTIKSLRETARDMIDQARDMHATGGDA